MIKVRIFYMVLLVSLGGLGQAQTAPASQKALDLRANVVHIKAKQDVGFGFITGEKEGKLYVVTAAHVLMEDDSVATAQPQLRFYQAQEVFEAKVVFEKIATDLAILEVEKPKDFIWLKNLRGKAAIGEDAAFIGRDGGWYVPHGRSLGTINDIPQNEIQVDINSVAPGTSGAPLVTVSGIVGMILDHSGYNSRVLSLQEIKRVFRKQDLPFQLTFEQYGLVGERLFDEDGNVYATMSRKGDIRWMAKNLNLEVEDSYCYKGDPANCEAYGRLYTWEVAKKTCPLLGEGWRLPTLEEWEALRASYRNPKRGYKHLREGGKSDFAAQLSGYRSNLGAFLELKKLGFYWSATEVEEGTSNFFGFNDESKKLYRSQYIKSGGLSVRCVQD